MTLVGSTGVIAEAPPPASARQSRVRALLLAGTTEARELAERMAATDWIAGVASLAGRTAAPRAQALPTRIGGFGGVAGLQAYLAETGVTHVVDATHAFAARMSANARAACAAAGVPLIVFVRAPWRPMAGDRWIDVADNHEATVALGDTPRRVFLTIGRQGVADFRRAPQHDYLLRVIDPPARDDLPPRCTVIAARGPFAPADEIALMRERRIDIVVTKNSGGESTYAKIVAARELGLPVAMIARPPQGDAPIVHDADAVMRFLAS